MFTHGAGCDVSLPHHSSPSSRMGSVLATLADEIINATATEAQNHISSHRHWLLLLAYIKHDDGPVVKFVS